MRPARYRRCSGWNCLGFSLVELLLVVAILALLSTLYWSPNSGSRQRALRAACHRNLEKVGVGLQIYANDHGGRYPFSSDALRSGQALQPLVPRYTSDTSLFICVMSKDSAPAPGVPLSNAKISYAYYMGRGASNVQEVIVTDAQVNTESKTPGETVFSPDGKAPGNNHGKTGGNLLFGDGHVQATPARANLPLPVREGERLLNP